MTRERENYSTRNMVKKSKHYKKNYSIIIIYRKLMFTFKIYK